MAGKANPEVTQARREIILAVLRLKSRLTIRELLDELLLIHERGDWPQATWSYARAAPYAGGLTQTLRAMQRRRVYKWKDGQRIDTGKWDHGTLVETECEDGCNRWGLAPVAARSRPTPLQARLLGVLCECGGEKNSLQMTCDGCIATRAEALLPDPRDVATAIRDYERSTGCEVVIGVTPGLVRVVRIGTQRGVIEHRLDEDDTWSEALEELGVA